MTIARHYGKLVLALSLATMGTTLGCTQDVDDPEDISEEAIDEEAIDEEAAADEALDEEAAADDEEAVGEAQDALSNCGGFGCGVGFHRGWGGRGLWGARRFGIGRGLGYGVGCGYGLGYGLGDGCGLGYGVGCGVGCGIDCGPDIVNRTVVSETIVDSDRGGCFY